jgi:hypothetical protein
MCWRATSCQAAHRQLQQQQQLQRPPSGPPPSYESLFPGATLNDSPTAAATAASAASLPLTALIDVQTGTPFRPAAAAASTSTSAVSTPTIAQDWRAMTAVSKWDLGSPFRNVCAVLGDNPLYWFVPIHPDNMGNGHSFPVPRPTAPAASASVLAARPMVPAASGQGQLEAPVVDDGDGDGDNIELGLLSRTPAGSRR